MVQQIIWSVEAEKNLVEIKQYITQHSLFYAEKIIRGLVAKAQTLLTHPEQGMIVLISGDVSYWRLLYKSYRIIYFYKQSTVYIVAVFHQARQIPDHFDNHLFS